MNNPKLYLYGTNIEGTIKEGLKGHKNEFGKPVCYFVKYGTEDFPKLSNKIGEAIDITSGLKPENAHVVTTMKLDGISVCAIKNIPDAYKQVSNDKLMDFFKQYVNGNIEDTNKVTLINLIENKPF